jgi:hypothetical protein
MVEVRYDKNHHAGATAEARIKHRLRPSNDTLNADSVTTVGNSPNRVVTSVHHSRNLSFGKDNPGEGDIFGGKKGPATRKGEVTDDTGR